MDAAQSLLDAPLILKHAKLGLAGTDALGIVRTDDVLQPCTVLSLLDTGGKPPVNEVLNL